MHHLHSDKMTLQLTIVMTAMSLVTSLSLLFLGLLLILFSLPDVSF